MKMKKMKDQIEEYTHDLRKYVRLQGVKKQILPEEIFLDSIVPLIRNLLVTNVNLSNNYFWNCTHSEIREDIIERGKYILERIENTKHLILDK